MARKVDSKEIIGVKERLKAFIKTLPISEREFCRQIDVSTSYVQSIKNSIQPKVMERISALYPELNPMWLLLGEGQMLLGEESAVSRAKKNFAESSDMLNSLLKSATEEKNRLLNIVESQQETIAELTRELKKVNARPGEDAGCAAVGIKQRLW